MLNRMLTWAVPAITLLFAPPSRAASFDCALARTPHETYICRTPALDAADARMGAAFRAATAAFPIKGFVAATQKLFLRDYASCDARRPGECLATVEARIAVLQSMHTDQVYAGGKSHRTYDPDDGVFWISTGGGTATLHWFGSFMPDMNHPEPFPDGFVCDDELPLTRTPTGWTAENPAGTATVTDDKVVSTLSCSPRNGMFGTFPRVR